MVGFEALRGCWGFTAAFVRAILDEKYLHVGENWNPCLI